MALNLSARTLALWVNQPLFDAAGVEVPTDFASFKAAAEALTNAEDEQFGLVLTNTARCPAARAATRRPGRGQPPGRSHPPPPRDARGGEVVHRPD